MHCAQARLLPHVLHRCLHPWTSANMCALQIYVRANMCICICMHKYEIQSFDFVVIGGTTSTPRRCTSTLSSTPTRKQPNARRPSWIDALRLGRQLIGAAWHDVHYSLFDPIGSSVIWLGESTYKHIKQYCSILAHTHCQHSKERRIDRCINTSYMFSIYIYVILSVSIRIHLKFIPYIYIYIYISIYLSTSIWIYIFYSRYIANSIFLSVSIYIYIYINYIYIYIYIDLFRPTSIHLSIYINIKTILSIFIYIYLYLYLYLYLCFISIYNCIISAYQSIYLSN